MPSVPIAPDEHRSWWTSVTDVPYGCCHCGCGLNTGIAARTDKTKFWWKGYPVRYANGHKGGIASPYYIEEDRGYDTPCWIWQRCIIRGYGSVRVGGKNTPAHRAMYERRYGPLSDTKELHHRCEVKPCVNPDHIQPLTQAEHSRLAHHVKLSVEAVKEMRRLRNADGLYYKDIAARYGVHTRTAFDAITRRTWKDC